MFSIEEVNNEVKCKTLEHSANIFHEALSDGERYYHVHNPAGQDYDIQYKGNTEWFRDKLPSYVGKILPEYIEYDENDKELIDIDFLNASSQYVCVKLTEYSIALVRVILKYTEKNVYCMDPRILWFIESSDRLHIGQMPEVDKDTMFFVGALGKGFVKGDPIDEYSNKKSDLMMFNCAFYMQALFSGKKKSQVKYMEFPVGKSVMGLGGILISTSCYKEFAKQLGLDVVYNNDRIGKFKVDDLGAYFNMDFKKIDSTEANTVTPENSASLYTTWRYYNIPGKINRDMLREKFYNELEEYAEAIIGERKTLGLLIRGTDYKSSGLSGSRQQATVDDMVPMIKEWMQQYGYERIVLATEDQDILNQMRSIFGNDVVAIAQERHTVSEFHKGQIINELEKELYSDEEYDSRIIETNINYFYALFLLSKCSGFMSSGQNNGWDTVNALKDGAFENVYKFMVGN